MTATTNHFKLTDSVMTPVAGPIFETKIEQFSGELFSGEESLPEKSVLGQ